MTSCFVEKLFFSHRCLCLWLYVATVALACAHTGQCVVFHNALPGDIADARWTNCILEHVFQCLRGHGEFLSTEQFYPLKDTIVYSDNHFGTGPIYAIFRLAGLSMEAAFAGWILVVISLDTIAVLFLLRRLRVHPLIASPLAFFAASSSTLVYGTGHPQLLPFFPFVFCLSFLLKFLTSGDAKQLAWAALWFAYQNWCFLYDGYFSIFICGAITVVYLILFARKQFYHRFLRSLRKHWSLVSGVLAFSSLALVLIYLPYARFSTQFGTRSITELVGLAPNPGAWFTASPYSVFYSKQQFYRAGEVYPDEKTLFSGWLFWILAPTIIITAIRNRQRRNMKLALVLVITVLLIIASITTWSGTQGSIYLGLAGRIQSIRAFRAFSRIAFLLIVIEAVSIAFFLNYGYYRTHSWLGRACVLVLACAVPAESLALGQMSYSKTVARRRAEALVQMWKKAGEREVLVFAPGYNNQMFSYVGNDCWQAALLIGKKTLNGYSGIIPPSHEQFVWNPTEANAVAVLNRFRVRKEICSIVTDWPQDVKESLSIRTYHLTNRAAPLAAVKTITVAPHASATIPVSVHSDEREELECNRLNLFASYRLYDKNDKLVPDPPSPRTLVGTLRRGDANSVGLRITAPSQPGVYEARLSMVQEGVAWWADLGSPGSVVNVIVASPYKLGDVIRFGRGGGSESFRASGWSQTEEQMTWTEGNSAVLNFSGLPRSQPLLLKMTIVGLTRAPELPAQPTEIYANGKEIADWQVADKREYMASIPADAVSSTGTLTLEFRVPKAASPKSLGINPDWRQLALGVFDLVIEQKP